jgi:hypothetical protein
VTFLCLWDIILEMEDPLEQYAMYRKEATNVWNGLVLNEPLTKKIEMATTDSVYQIQRQLFARSERVKGIDFHPVEPWILTTLYSGTSLGAWSVRSVVCANCFQVMSTYGHTRLRYASSTTSSTSDHTLTPSRQ